METQETLGLIDENIKYLAITFFFGIFWGAMISNMHFYKLFKIWPKSADHCSKKKKRKQLGRFVYGVSILNILPLFLFIILINDFWGYIQIIPETQNTHIVFICSGVASLSVFSFSFFLPGLLQIKFHNYLYPKPTENNESDCWTWKKIAKESNIAEDPVRGFVNLLVGVLYLIIPLVVSLYIGGKYA